MQTWRNGTVAVLAMAALGVEAAVGQGTPTTWLTRLGRDTIAFERFTRTADRLEGDFIVTVPRSRLTHYQVTFERGLPVRFEISARSLVDGPGAAPPASALIQFGDTIVSIISRGGKVDTTKAPGAPGVLPNAFYSWGTYGLAVEAAVAAGGETTVGQFGFGSRQIAQTKVSRVGDSLAVDFFGSPMMVALDRDGTPRAINGARTTLKVLAERTPGLDFDRLQALYVARERSGRVAGALSTRDTVLATVAGAELWVDYGRPFKRGRQIVGGVVPFDSVWRTGANAATQLRTSRDLRIGATTIPAGSYTLWTVPTTRGVTLIFNRQVGQWGTEYQAAQDQARVDLDVEKLDAPVEQFTISVVPEADGGALRFDWDRTRWVARFRPPS